jgi:hypothetical protein
MPAAGPPETAWSVPERDGAGSPLDGALLSAVTRLLLVIGTLGALLFTAVYLVEGATRPGYDAWSDAVSLLSLGPGGWVQRANFILFGLLTLLCSAPAWHRALRPGPAAAGYPLLKAAEGLGLVVIGVFSQDPAAGYPPGASIPPRPTAAAEVHLLFSFVTILAIALGSFFLARRLALEALWGPWWAAAAAVTGVLTIAFIAAFGWTSVHGGPAGLFERLSTGVASLLTVVVVARLLVQARAGGGEAPMANG